MEKVEKLIEKYDVPASINYANSLFTIFFSKEKVENLEDAIKTSDDFYSIYFDVMLENGIIVPPSKYEAHFISYIHSDEDYNKYFSALEKVFQKIKK